MLFQRSAALCRLGTPDGGNLTPSCQAINPMTSGFRWKCLSGLANSAEDSGMQQDQHTHVPTGDLRPEYQACNH